MSFAAWSLVVGLMLITLSLSGTFLKRLPFSTAMLYLAAGVILGRTRWSVLAISPLNHALILERLTEVAVLISLFSVGLKLGTRCLTGTGCYLFVWRS